MKTGSLFLLFIFLIPFNSNAQNSEFGLHYLPNKFRLTNEAEKDTKGDYSEIAPTLRGSSGVGFFYNKLLNKQNGLQFDLDFLNQKQFYNYSSLSEHTNNIYTKLNTINLGISHNLYLWDYENDDNIFFSYGISFRSLMNYTDYYNVEITTKINGEKQTENINSIIEDNKMITTDVVRFRDSVISISGDVKTASPRYSSMNIGANFSLNFLHYFSDNFAFTIGAKGVFYFMDPENRASQFWSSNSKYKYGTIATSDKRAVTKMNSFGLNLSIVYCLGR